MEDLDEVYRLIDETMSLLDHVLQQLSRIRCGRGGREDTVLRGPAYNIYVDISRAQDNLRKIRHFLSSATSPSSERRTV